MPTHSDDNLFGMSRMAKPRQRRRRVMRGGQMPFPSTHAEMIARASPTVQYSPEVLKKMMSIKGSYPPSSGFLGLDAIS
jgi:hypothetical protein